MRKLQDAKDDGNMERPPPFRDSLLDSQRTPETTGDESGFMDCRTIGAMIDCIDRRPTEV